MKLSKTVLLFFTTAIFSANVVWAQTLKLNNKNSSLIVSGTSSLHDWDISAEDISGTLDVDLGEIVKISKLEVVVKSESLKSGKNGMDKNTYKALKTDRFETIKFKLKTVNEIAKVKDAYYEVSAVGDLTVAGVTRSVHLRFFLQVIEKKILIMGNIELRMTEFEIEPPRALLGTIKTGDLINIKFNTIFK